MQKCWRDSWPSENDDFFYGKKRVPDELRDWIKMAKDVVVDAPITDSDVPTQRDKSEIKTIKANHGSFDNNLNAVNSAVARILGRKKPKVEITDLRGF